MSCRRQRVWVERLVKVPRGGTYNPLTDPATVTVDAEKAQQWIKNGAQPTDTVRGLLKKANVL